MGLVNENLLKLKEEHSFRKIFSILCENRESIAAIYTEYDETKKITFTEYEKLVKNAAYCLSQIVGEENKGAYIGIKLDNCYEWPILFWSTLMAGYKPILVDFRLDDKMTTHLLEQSQSIGLISFEEKGVYKNKIQIAPGELIGNEASKISTWKEDWADEVAMCTSGTTSTSKIFVYNGHALSKQILNAEQIYKINPLLMNDGEIRILAFLPFNHIFGFFAVYLWYSFFGKTLVYLKNRTPNAILEACKKHNVTHIYAVPLLWNNLASNVVKEARKLNQEEKFYKALKLSLFLQNKFPVIGRNFASKRLFKDIHSKLFGDCTQFLISGGGYVLPETLRILNGIGLNLVCGFGMTEVGITSVELEESLELKLSSNLGKPFSSVQYKIIPYGNAEGYGELYIKGESIHIGRLENGKLLPSLINKEGWFATGDIASIKNGNLLLHGRIKDVIINESGENVYPDEIEIYFSNLSYVNELCVVGIRSVEKYEDITLIMNIGDYFKDKSALVEIAKEIYMINGNLPVYKRVKRVLISIEPLSRFNGMKLQRQKLKQFIEEDKLQYIEFDIKQLVETAEETVAAALKEKEIKEEENSELKDIKELLRSNFSEVLGISASEIKDSAHFIEDLGGDSLQSIDLFTRIEEKFNIIIPSSEYYKCTNIDDLSSLLLKKLHGIGPGAGDEITSKDIEERTVIESFEQTKEYKAFETRMELLGGVNNPYFIRHDSVVKDISVVDGKAVINFGSYNYVGLSGHPETVMAAQIAVEKYGTSASGSRLICGEKGIFRELEMELAKWKHSEEALVLVSGHATNVTFIGNFCSDKDLILYDALSHNSIEQACRLSRSESRAFPHNDYKALEKILERCRPYYEKILVVVEGVYSMDGDIAPIPELVQLKKKYKLFLMVDEAHSSCVIGKTGGGVDEYFNLESDDVDFKVGTLSKGLGTCGGYIAGKKNVIEYLRYNLPGFVFSVGIAPPTAAAALAAVKLLQRDSTMVEKLQENIECFLSEAHRRNFNTCLAEHSAIVPIMVGGDMETFMLSNLLLKNGVYVPPAVYPAVPRGQGRLRFCVTSEHSKEQIIQAMDLLKKLTDELGISLPN